jgi:hypothetical protein
MKRDLILELNLDSAGVFIARKSFSSVRLAVNSALLVVAMFQSNARAECLATTSGWKCDDIPVWGVSYGGDASPYPVDPGGFPVAPLPDDAGAAAGGPPESSPYTCSEFLTDYPPASINCSPTMNVSLPKWGAGCNFHFPATYTSLLDRETTFYQACETHNQCDQISDEEFCDAAVQRQAMYGCTSSFSGSALDSCVDDVGDFMYSIKNDPHSLNLKSYAELQAGRLCSDWQSAYKYYCH